MREWILTGVVRSRSSSNNSSDTHIPLGCLCPTSAFLAWCSPPLQLMAVSHSPWLRRTAPWMLAPAYILHAVESGVRECGAAGSSKGVCAHGLLSLPHTPTHTHTHTPRSLLHHTTFHQNEKNTKQSPAVIVHAVKHGAVVVEVVLDQPSLVLRQVLAVQRHLRGVCGWRDTAHSTAQQDTTQ